MLAITGRTAADQVRVLASFEPQTSGSALGACLLALEETVKVLGDNLVFGVLRQLDAERAAIQGAAELSEQVRLVFRQDEVNAPLAARVRSFAEQAQGLLRPQETSETRHVRSRERVNAAGKRAAREALELAVQRLRAAIDSSSDEVQLSGELVVSDKQS